ncbi:hypothetical protein A3860_33700 [Niastella vici]|uniref:Uncharacterized protein n=1 Tax=Niastella vici TaxID=1703345 RepID=A0A1V9FQ02_9BACT|nr:hypothetical protein [Niastella vici]OQP60336.1 hypothetical protein A3860_33700 [Niastella vici]
MPCLAQQFTVFVDLDALGFAQELFIGHFRAIMVIAQRGNAEPVAVIQKFLHSWHNQFDLFQVLLIGMKQAFIDCRFTALGCCRQAAAYFNQVYA